MPEDLQTLLPYAAYAALFVGVMLAFEGLRRLADRKETDREARNRRMRMLADGKSRDQVYQLLSESGALKAGSQSRWSLPNPSRTLKQAGAPIGFFALLVLSVLLGAGTFLAANMFVTTTFSAILAITVLVGFPYVFVTECRKKWLEKLGAQLPDALSLMARGLKVGHPLNVTVQRVAEDMADPIGTEFGIIEDQVAYGEDLVTAFSQFAERTGLEDVRYLAVSVGIQHGTGGDLARVLTVLSKVIRDRATMRKKISAISAEGRISAFILSVLPFGIFGLVHFSTPSFYGDVWDDPLFIPFMAAIITLVALQAAILHRLVNFRF